MHYLQSDELSEPTYATKIITAVFCTVCSQRCPDDVVAFDKVMNIEMTANTLRQVERNLPDYMTHLLILK